MTQFDRRQLLRGAAAFGSGFATVALLPGWALSATPGLVSTLPTLSGQDIKLTIGHAPVTDPNEARQKSSGSARAKIAPKRS
ncbi:MAG: hypothetical protein B7Z44_18545, partial [Caulobacter sp. 12-67-6]